MKGSQSHQSLCHCRVMVLLLLLIGACYLHTLDASWHLDDIDNIVTNSKIHMNILSIDAAKKSFFAAPASEELYRPVAMLSFAVNWYLGKNNVYGYHLINIAVHLATAFFLFLTLLALFRTPNMKGVSHENAFFVALLGAVLWALHPIQIQAVTYIVQRMASLAALFYLMALWAYVAGRLSHVRRHRLCFYILCISFYLLAIGAKENTFILPASLILVELVFFQDARDPFIQKLFWISVAAGSLILIGGMLYIVLNWESFSFMIGYRTRPFTIFERLMTQFRVLTFYLSQIAYPIPSRFSITHDYVLSRSLIAPWTTLPAILLIFGLIGFSLNAIRQSVAYRLTGFAILFFFINHVVESTILPLEMIFEHRNYLPSLFLFFPVALGIKSGLDHYRSRNRAMFVFLVLSTSALLAGLGISTYVRNMDWRSERSLWQDAMVKAPKSARPPHNLAWGYYSPTGQFDRAIALYKHSVNLEDHTIGFEAVTYFNLAGIYYSKLRDDEKAIDYAIKTLQINPRHIRAGYVLAGALTRLGQYEEALSHLTWIPGAASENADNLYLKGFLYLKTQQPENALTIFRRCLALSPHHWRYLREIGFSLTQMRYHNQAYWFFKQAEKIQPDQPELLMGLAANRMAMDLLPEAETYVERWVNAVGMDHIESYLEIERANPMGLPIPYDLTVPVISKILVEKSNQYLDTAHRLTPSLSETQVHLSR